MGLKGVKYKELLSVLNFMYQGEVNVAQEELNSFLTVAKDLHVKGLTQNNSSTSSSSTDHSFKQRAPSPKISRPPAPPERDPVSPPKRPRPAAPPQSYHQDDNIQEEQPIVKSEPVSAPAEVDVVQSQSQQQVALKDEPCADESYDYCEYGDGGYHDVSGMIDPNTSLPIQGAVGA